MHATHAFEDFLYSSINSVLILENIYVLNEPHTSFMNGKWVEVWEEAEEFHLAVFLWRKDTGSYDSISPFITLGSGFHPVSDWLILSQTNVNCFQQYFLIMWKSSHLLSKDHCLSQSLSSLLSPLETFWPNCQSEKFKADLEARGKKNERENAQKIGGDMGEKKCLELEKPF